MVGNYLRGDSSRIEYNTKSSSNYWEQKTRVTSTIRNFTTDNDKRKVKHSFLGFPYGAKTYCSRVALSSSLITRKQRYGLILGHKTINSAEKPQWKLKRRNLIKETHTKKSLKVATASKQASNPVIYQSLRRFHAHLVLLRFFLSRESRAPLLRAINHNPVYTSQEQHKSIQEMSVREHI